MPSKKYPHLELEPDVPGRGAWKTKGGLLPVTPTSKDTKRGYYRRSIDTEVMVGRKGSALTTATFSERMVWYGVREIQRLMGVKDDGLFGDQTQAAVVQFQRQEGLDADGIWGPATAKAAYSALIRQTAAEYNVPSYALGGMALWESGLDPAAVGVNGLDLGLVQINTGVHVVSMLQATSGRHAFVWAASDLELVIEKWQGKTKVDPVKIAIANHNNPSLAKQWATTGTPPFSQSREDNGFPQIDEYVASVLAAGEDFR
jgi:hypothetical protein